MGTSTRELGEHIVSKMPKEKRPLSSDDSDSGPEDRAPLPKSQKKSLHKEAPAKPKSSGGASSGGGGASDDKDADGNPMWDLGNMKKVVVRDFKGKTYIDIREYYVDKNTMDTRPGKKGISLNCLQYQKLKSIIDDIDHALP